jgi:hypothetical protein
MDDRSHPSQAESARSREEHIQSWWDLLKASVSAGRTAFLYRSVYVEVDSVVDKDVTGEFDITQLQVLGLDGWEIVAVIPRTLGVALRNLLSLTEGMGGGMGGNVAGVHVLLRLAVDGTNLEGARADLEDVIDNP